MHQSWSSCGEIQRKHRFHRRLVITLKSLFLSITRHSCVRVLQPGCRRGIYRQVYIISIEQSESLRTDFKIYGLSFDLTAEQESVS